MGGLHGKFYGVGAQGASGLPEDLVGGKKNTMMRRATLCWVDSPKSMGKKHQGQPHRGSDKRATAVTARASDEFPG